MTELHAVWTSLARPAIEDRPGLAFADDTLIRAWQNAPDKGAYVDRLPPLEAARLCDLLNVQSHKTPGRPVIGRAGRSKR